MFTLHINNERIAFNQPAIMGIINATPDSFFENSRVDNTTQVLKKVEQMLHEGADFIDIGGQSTRPNSELINENEELKKVIPIIEAVKKEFPKCIISIDTFYSGVAKACIENGASIINDVSGGEMDKKMFETAASLNVPYVCMHMKGTPQTMQQHTNYTNVVEEVLNYFNNKKQLANELGIEDFIVDIGFGFSKTIEQNFELIKNLKQFATLQKPLLVGVSRKSSIYKTLNTTADKALNGTTVLHTIALLNGANILRVHDVKEAVECVKLCSFF